MRVSLSPRKSIGFRARAAGLLLLAALVFFGCGDGATSGSARLECQPFARPFEVDPQEYPFRSCAFETSAGVMHYFDEGPRDADETILFVHGNPTWSFLYRNIAKAMLADGHRVVVPDHIGMGMSDLPSRSEFDYLPRSHADHLEQLVVALNLTNVTVVGQDWGGPIGLGMATRQHERIARMLIMNTWAWSIDHTDPGVFHALTTWTNQNQNQNRGRGNPRLNFFCDLAVPGIAGFLAAQVDPARGAVYEKVRNAYVAPAIDQTTGEFRHPEPCAPMQIFAEAIGTDDAYQGEVEARLGNLRGKPYSLLFGLRDNLFGALRCDTARTPSCPGSSTCSCDPELLPMQVPAQCVGNFPEFDVCKEPDGAVVVPYTDRFVELLGAGSLVRRDVVPSADHMIQEFAPDRVIQALRELLTTD